MFLQFTSENPKSAVNYKGKFCARSTRPEFSVNCTQFNVVSRAKDSLHIE